jgi:hypothetical protein
MFRFALLIVLVSSLVVSAQDLPKGEELPEIPKADAKSDVKPLLPDKTLYLEKKPDGTKRILVVTEVCLREGALEVLLTKKNTKEHEAILRTATDAKFLHAALEASGLKVGTPVQYVNPKTMEDDFKAPTGQKMTVTVHYKKDGKLHTHAVQEWVMDTKTKKVMAEEWVFVGSRFIKDPEQPNQPAFYGANNGEVIALSNSFDAMLDLPTKVSKDDANLNYRANTEKIPPLLSQVWLILEPVEEKKK